MRNKKLHRLTEQARKASEELTTYLTLLDARETDANYVHARMLFEEGWRLHDHGHRSNEHAHRMRYMLWMDAGDAADAPPARSYAEDLPPHGDPTEVLKALQLTQGDIGVVNFLLEITLEVGGDVPRAEL